MLHWTHKDEWRLYPSHGEPFCITVEHFTVAAIAGFTEDRGTQRWCVYAYVYPTHPLYGAINRSGGIYQPALDALPLHGGCTLLSPYWTETGGISSYKIGADYDHLHDEAFRTETRFEGSRVQADALALFQDLLAMVPALPAPATLAAVTP